MAPTKRTAEPVSQSKKYLPSDRESQESPWALRPQRGLPDVDGPLGGAFLIPRPIAVVGDFILVAANARPLFFNSVLNR
jgi:hypothetical protein